MFSWDILRYFSSIYFPEHLWITTSGVIKQKMKYSKKDFFSKYE